MAERDSTNTPVAAEALIAAAEPLALHRIPPGAPPRLPAAPAPLGVGPCRRPPRARPRALPHRTLSGPLRGPAVYPAPRSAGRDVLGCGAVWGGVFAMLLPGLSG